MVKAVRLHLLREGRRTVQYEEVKVGQPGPGGVEVRHTAIAAHLWDEQLSRGHGDVSIPEPLHLPQTLGLGAVGVVTELGSGVLNLHIGQRVVYSTLPAFGHRPSAVAGGLQFVCTTSLANAPLGSFCEARVIPADCLVSVPDDIPEQAAAAVFLPGLVAWVLLRKLSHVRAGDSVLVHDVSSGGGLGWLLCQWLRALGAFVVGTVRSQKEVLQAEVNGCAHALLLPSPERKQGNLEVALPERAVLEAAVVHGKAKDFVHIERETIKQGGPGVHGVEDDVVVEQTLAATEGKGVKLLFEVQPCRFARSVAPNGTVVRLKGVLTDYLTSRSQLAEASAELFELIRKSVLRVPIGSTYQLRAAAEALANLSAHEVVGAAILLPPIPDPRFIPSGS